MAGVHELTHGGLVLDVDDTGPVDGPTVVLLHGWPQDRGAWSGVTERLAVDDVRVVAPDQRGYSPRARPRARAAYRMPELVADVRELVLALGGSPVHLVGHDWGGAVAWAFAERHPELLHSLTVLSTPHHDAMAWALRHGGQARRSWYMLAFQLPLLPEAYLRPRLAGLLEGSGLPAQDARRYAARFRQPGAARGGLAWYRALPLGAHPLRALRRRAGALTGRAQQPSPPRLPRRITVPTTYLWGRHDPALGRAAAERTARHVGAAYRFVELDAGHWLPETHPDEVAAAIRAQLCD